MNHNEEIENVALSNMMNDQWHEACKLDQLEFEFSDAR